MDTLTCFFNDTCASIFLFGCKIVNRITEFFHNLYESNPVVHAIVDYTKQAYCILTLQHIEPLQTTWISKCYIKPSNGTYDFYEDYQTERSIETNKTNELLYIIKTADEKNAVCYFSYIDKIKTPEFKKSNVRFLLIEYDHPGMEESVTLALEKSWLYVGNELFNPTFVLRTLKYQSLPFIFSMDYIITIMDSDANPTIIKSDSHIVLTNDGFSVINKTALPTNVGSSWKTTFEKSMETLDKAYDQLLVNIDG